MVVQHNLQAMNANRMLGVTQGQQAKSTEKLSSGYKINRAADDAAGLSISEKMRKQIRGLDQATENAQDGISMVQIADGALEEVTAMLQRGNELAVQAANGTNSASDRQAIQDEIDQLMTEINRVGETTKFNETYVLQGDSEVTEGLGHMGDLPATVTKGAGFTSGKTTESLSAYSLNDKKYTGLGVSADFSAIDTEDELNELYGAGFSATCQGCGAYKTIKFVQNGYSEMWKNAGNQPYQPDGTPASTAIFEVDISKDILDGYMASTDGIAKGINTYGKAIGYAIEKQLAATATGDTNNKVAGANFIGNSVHGVVIGIGDNGAGGKDYSKICMFDTRYFGAAAIQGGFSQVMEGYTDKTKSATPVYREMNLHVGADADMTNKINVKLANISTLALGLDDIGYDAVHGVDTESHYADVTTEKKATDAITAFGNAIAYVSAERSRMGAYQNRLEHTVNNLSNVVENTTSAESRIRDTDMAEEMVTYSKTNILAQAGQSMLAQANQSTQGVLSLLG